MPSYPCSVPRALLLVAALALSAGALAQIGQPPERLQETLAASGPVDEAGFRYDSVERGGLLYRVEGSATLDPRGIERLAELVGAATGYGEGISEPVAQFFEARADELVGQGPLRLAVEQYWLELEVTRTDGAPALAAFAVALQEIPEDAFPVLGHALGPDDATVVIREFSDFQCPFCARFAQQALPALKESLLASDDVRFEYHHLPLDSIHANARPAAEASECVAELAGADAFWPFHDALFERLQAWSGLGDPSAYFVRLADEIGVGADGLRECIDERRFADRVQEAFVGAANLGLRGTPSVFVNGFRVANPFDMAEYERALELVRAFRE